MGAVPPLVGEAVNVTFVPEHMAPAGEAATDTEAVPAPGELGVSVLNILVGVSPFAVPVTDDGLIVPVPGEVLVGCTCNPTMVNWSVTVLLAPATTIVKEVDVIEVAVTLVIFLPVVKASVGDTAELNCHPAGAAKTMVTDQAPETLPKSALLPSFTVMVPSVVQCGALPVEA